MKGWVVSSRWGFSTLVLMLKDFRATKINIDIKPTLLLMVY